MGRKLASFLSVPVKQKEPTATSENNVIATSLDAGPVRSEQPKSVLSSPFWGVAYLLQLVALGLTVAVLQLSFRKVYFADVGAKGLLGGLNVEESVKAIQFAAKLHEIFMVASLAAIISHLTRSCLLGKRGVPLGLVSAPFKVSSLDYIFSQEFWGSITRPYGMFSLGILLSTIFMLGLGPASAMALVPSLGWWNVPDPYSGLDRPIWVGAHLSDLWPQTITPDIVKDVCITQSNSTIVCPAEGFGDIEAWGSSKVYAGQSANFTMQESISGVRRRLVSQHEEVSNETYLSYFPHTLDLNNVSMAERAWYTNYTTSSGVTTLTTTGSNWVAILLGGFWEYAKSVDLGLINQSARPKFRIDNFPVYEPLVSSRCNVLDYYQTFKKQDNITAPFVRNAFGATGFTGFNNTGWVVPPSAWMFDRPLDALNFTWVDLQGLDVNASIGALFSVPYATSSPNGTSLQQSVIAPCTVEARWVASELVYDPMSSDILLDNVTDPIDFAHDNNSKYDTLDAAARFGASPIINITSDWANLLNLPASNLTFPGDNSSVGHILHKFMGTTDPSIFEFDSGLSGPRVSGGSYSAGLEDTLSTILGFVVADGLSRFQYGTKDLSVIYRHDTTTSSRTSLMRQAGSLARIYNETHASNLSSNLEDTGTFGHLDVQRWGYGYGIETKASQFSVTMLMLYGCVVLVYIIWFNIQNLVRPRSDWSLVTNKWANISGMLALAINSPPSAKLDGTCAGVEDNQSLKQVVRIREVEDKHLALVVGEEQDEHPRVQRNVQYG